MNAWRAWARKQCPGPKLIEEVKNPPILTKEASDDGYRSQQPKSKYPRFCNGKRILEQFKAKVMIRKFRAIQSLGNQFTKLEKSAVQLMKKC